MYMPPEGPDKGVDLLAAPGTLGFGEPRICVQVKSGDSPVDRMVLDQLRGVMENFNADRGLLVRLGWFQTDYRTGTGCSVFSRSSLGSG